MSFTDLHFIIVFLPAFLIIYYISLNLFRKSTMPANIVLLIGSLLFCLYSDYTSGTYVSTLILSMVTIINYFITRLTDYYYGKERFIKLRTFLFVMTVVLDVALLVIYKIIIGRLPLGISFYTFTILAYVTDTYFRKTETETNFINMAAYITMFPRLVQGPISRYESFEKNMHKRHVSLRRFDKALKLFILGMSYKVLVADRLAGLFTELQKIGFESVSTPLAWLGAVSYSLQLYFDFAGYTLMAIGVGSMLGFRLPQNFDNPYASRSISEFYRRWHITLGTWFKDYIFYPLSINKSIIKLGKWTKEHINQSFGKRVPIYLPMLIVWAATGMWHGSEMRYVVWGLMNFMFIVIGTELEPYSLAFVEKHNLNETGFMMKSYRVIKTFWLMSFLRIFDISKDVKSAFQTFGYIFKEWGSFSINNVFENLSLPREDFIVAVVAILILFAVSLIDRYGSVRERIFKLPVWVQWLILSILIVAVSVFGYYGPGYDSQAFIYLQF